MSKNKGKNGEMRIAKLLCDISIKEEGCDFTRHTNTNTADSGADLVFEHPEGFSSYLVSIASGTVPTTQEGQQLNNIVKTRIDVKTTDNKISPDTVDKFGGDIRKNPDCQGHLLIGGSGMSKEAQKRFKSIQEAAKEDGKIVDYIPNTGINNLEAHYQALPNPNNQPKNKEDT